MRASWLVLAWALLASLPLHAREGPPDPVLLDGLRYRLIGPFRGGRANAVAGIPGDRSTYYFGAAAGGVWKTTDGGTNWEPIFDEQKTAAIGAIAVSPSDPNVVYVGTGDAKLRGNVSRGNGVHKSLDAGRTWKHVGLERSYHIGRLIVHPRDPDVVFVAALGSAFGPNPERGIFRSRDGGESWEHVLFVDPQTGGIDVHLDPANPDVLMAALWQVVRKPYDLVSGGPGSALYRSTDGGDSWERLSGGGLPHGILGKVGVAISPADPQRVYALIEAEEGGLYRSDDGAETWRRVNRSHALTQRAWYFMQVVPDPVSADVLYVLNIPLLRSVDGGQSFQAVDQFHVDNHDLWIDPKDPLHMISGNDGGANVTVNGGRTWTRSDDNQPTGQFYHLATDGRFPYHLYGSQQDYETIAIASRGAGGGITRADWYAVGGCEMGFVAPHPRKPDIVYAGCTDGGISRYDHRTRRNQSIEPWPETNIGHPAGDARYRFQWTAPILVSPNDPSALYMASNVLFKSVDEGMSWSVISPDLTRNDPETLGPAGGPLTKDNVGTEVYGTIFALAESPRQKDLLWAGSDDGLVHLTRDGGRSWTPVTPEEMPAWSRISMIEASPHDPAVAYLAVDRHLLDDFAPYVYKAWDFGRSWTSITNGLPPDTFVRVVREDPVRRGLLYAGTETGVFVSLDDGANWQPLQLNLPVSPVHDLVVKDGDLVVATHGRALWILDDIAPLRQMNETAADTAAYLFEPTAAYRIRDDYSTIKTPAGSNPPPGLVVYYTLRSPPEGEITLSILDDQGELVDSFSSLKPGGLSGPNPFGKTSSVGTSAGLNRWVWDLRYPGPRFIPGHVLFMHAPHAPPVGPLAPAGTYGVKLTVEGQTLEAAFEILPDPRVEASADLLRSQFELHRELVEELTALNDAVMQNRRIREQLESLGKRAEGAMEVQEAARRIEEKLIEIEQALIEPRMETGSDAFNFPTRLDAKLVILIGIVANSDTAPTRSSYEVATELAERIGSELGRMREVIALDIAELNRLARDRGILAIRP